MKKLLSQIISAVLGLWLADLLVPEVFVMAYPDSSFFGISLASPWAIYLALGIVLGLLNSFVRPIINAIALPLRIITLGIFSIVVSMSMLWMLDAMFNEISVPLFLPLFYSTLIIWTINFLIAKLLIKDKD